ncbi:MAG: type III-A CRISPR-associated RAMP protein Csm3 [Bacteroidetes bacterium]|nr:type III-A CRISPR-associated RAMP protein Csm3 [Bacteroidota bacterium]
MNKLLKKIEITGVLTLETGLHIGGTNSSMSIGGIDKAVIRNPLNNQPFIPGSSLKGKMRSLVEISSGNIGGSSGGVVNNGPSSNIGTSDHPLSADLFGNAINSGQKPSRLIVRDLPLINHEELLAKTEIPYTEGKTEVVIDRITSAAMPRQNERVPAGATFRLNLIVNIWEQDNNEEELIELLFTGLQLLSDDYLGGHGSRGYGQVSIDIEGMIEKSSTEFYFGKNNAGKSIMNKYTKQIERLKSKKQFSE